MDNKSKYISKISINQQKTLITLNINKSFEEIRKSNFAFVTFNEKNEKKM